MELPDIGKVLGLDTDQGTGDPVTNLFASAALHIRHHRDGPSVDVRGTIHDSAGRLLAVVSEPHLSKWQKTRRAWYAFSHPKQGLRSLRASPGGAGAERWASSVLHRHRPPDRLRPRTPACDRLRR